MLRHISLTTFVTALMVTLGVTAIFSVTVGPMNISTSDTLSSLFQLGNLEPHIDVVIREIRLPRTLLCMLIGAILALCGVVMQGLFRNPLAEPGIIGVSAGAALGGAIAIVLLSPLTMLSASMMNLAVLPVASFVGGALATGLVYKNGLKPIWYIRDYHAACWCRD